MQTVIVVTYETVTDIYQSRQQKMKNTDRFIMNCCVNVYSSVTVTITRRHSCGGVEAWAG